MCEIGYGKTPPRFGENAVTLPLDVDRPCYLEHCLQPGRAWVPYRDGRDRQSHCPRGPQIFSLQTQRSKGKVRFQSRLRIVMESHTT